MEYFYSDIPNAIIVGNLFDSKSDADALVKQIVSDNPPKSLQLRERAHQINNMSRREVLDQFSLPEYLSMSQTISAAYAMLRSYYNNRMDQVYKLSKIDGRVHFGDRIIGAYDDTIYTTLDRISNDEDFTPSSGFPSLEEAEQYLRTATERDEQFIVSWEAWMDNKIKSIVGEDPIVNDKWGKFADLAGITGRGKLNLKGTGNGRITMEFRAMEGITDGKRLEEYVEFLRYFVERFKDEQVLPSPRFGSPANNLESILPGKPGQTWHLVGDEQTPTEIAGLTQHEQNIAKFLQNNNLDIINNHEDSVFLESVMESIGETSTESGRKNMLDFYGSLDHGELVATAHKVANALQKSAEGVDPRKVVQERVRQLSVSLDRGTSEGVIGRHVSGPEEIAVMGQFVRNPSAENTWVIYVKDGKIIEHESATLNSSQETVAPPIDQLRARVEHFEADGFYLLHNHPGGVATFSDGDLNVSNRYAYANSDIFMGAVVINSGTYAYYFRGEDGIYGVRGMPVNEQQLPSELVGWDTDSPYQEFGDTRYDNFANQKIRRDDPLYQDIVTEEGLQDRNGNHEIRTQRGSFVQAIYWDSENISRLTITGSQSDLPSADGRLESLVEFRGLTRSATTRTL